MNGWRVPFGRNLGCHEAGQSSRPSGWVRSAYLDEGRMSERLADYGNKNADVPQAETNRI
ncbi:hypothetical protein [Rhizobium leguminosarum]|jgi:hypothetical protein|uniref:hypothetical protein n=1 Tax=Rhizobium TaxID=379 RepID=UPI00140FA347|nr:hypothetical protein [Rhizobium leguminosarum]QIO63986.1 hypothetical protein HA462_02490 [Rhizobium leguminosarum bv. trifolii]